MTYKNGVIIACDTLGSYGSLARFKDVVRVIRANNETIVACDGDLSDFQNIEKMLKNIEIADACYADGLKQGPKDVLNMMAREMYRRRSKMDPFWNNVIVAGFSNGRTFLGTTDLIGTQYEDNFIATGLGAHMALPILREGWRADMTEAEARALVESCMKVLYYRDTQTINKIIFATVGEQGPNI